MNLSPPDQDQYDFIFDTAREMSLAGKLTNDLLLISLASAMMASLNLWTRGTKPGALIEALYDTATVYRAVEAEAK